eukprot:512509-Pleurochrysis_carterae.AAC.1
MTTSPRRNAQIAGMLAGFQYDLSSRRRLRSGATRQQQPRNSHTQLASCLWLSSTHARMHFCKCICWHRRLELAICSPH